MSLISVLIGSLSLLVIIGIIIININTLGTAKDKIFSGSGVPVKMADTIYNALQLTSQNIVGIFIVTILLILISEKLLEATSGLTLIATLSGYMIGKSYMTNEVKDENKKE